jgi:hypothetical protein
VFGRIKRGILVLIVAAALAFGGGVLHAQLAAASQSPIAGNCPGAPTPC